MDLLHGDCPGNFTVSHWSPRLPSVRIQLIDTNSDNIHDARMGALLGLLWALWSLSLARNDICYCWSPWPLYSVHVMHHSSITDACTHSWGWYGPNDDRQYIMCFVAGH